MKIKRFLPGGVTAACLLMPLSATAIPVTYSYTTDANAFGNNAALVSQFTGLSVSGTFDYDADTPPLFTAPNGNVVYDPAVTNLNGQTGSYAFNDAGPSIALVGNDTGPTGDILLIAADPALDSGAPPALFTLSGFDVAGFTLVNVRLFWLENVLGAGDFLDGTDLLDTLPAFAGRLALDFNPTGNLDPSLTTQVFFNNLLVTPVSVPAPATLLLLAMATLPAFGLRRRRPARFG